MVRIASATGVPCATSTSPWRSLETISSGVCLFLPIVVILLRLRSHTSGWTTPTGADHFGDALRVLETYRRLQRSGALFHSPRDGDQVVLNYLPYEGETGAGLIAECALASLTHVLRDL